MEFHEMLQRDLVKKDKIITKMKEELVVLRGPVRYFLSPLTEFNALLLLCDLSWPIISANIWWWSHPPNETFMCLSTVHIGIGHFVAAFCAFHTRLIFHDFTS